MTISLFSVNVCLIAVVLFSAIPFIHALGSGATLAVIDDDSSSTVCGIVAGQTTQCIECYHRGQIVSVTPNISFSLISGGKASSVALGPVTTVCSAGTLSLPIPMSSKRKGFTLVLLFCWRI
ncbi:hypothetical protein QN277_004584 [Acacia crassicarpa]|uniref:Secreted protein n=1 Tax=Acacia crassicarpa TaxID=499986 RepID=A0AAE1J4N9_9FABA|nr:hypothetical protein QN277_004584 [Acacia crassicarpa]